MPATKTKRPRKAKPRPAPLPAKAPDPANPETVLVLRTCRKDMTSHNGFKWPESGPVECPDWDPAPKCGNGLHGLAWGEGNWALLGNDQTDKWLVVQVAAADLVKIDDEKVKFKRGVVVFCGQMADAVTRVLCSAAEMARIIAIAGEKATGYSSTAASSGDYSAAASSGYSSTAASSGDSSAAASSGNYSAAASSGDYSKAASSGYSSTAASSGNYSAAAAEGKNTIACVAGMAGQAKAGEGGAFTLAYKDASGRIRIAVGYPGEDGIKADTWYRVENEKLVEVK